MTGARLIVDGLNVIGSRPDGWWKDRRGAMTRFAGLLLEWGEPVLVVFDGRDWDGAPQDEDTLAVRWAPGGRDAADDEIVRLVEADPDPAGLVVVTSDAALAERVRAAGAAVEGARAFRRRVEAAVPESERP